MLKIMNKNCQF